MANGINGTLEYSPADDSRSDGKGSARVSRSGHGDLKNMFSASPVHDGTALIASKAEFKKVRFEAFATNERFPDFDPNYSGAPDMSDTPEGAASPFVPNPSSPTDGVKPSSKPAAPDGYGAAPTHDVSSDEGDSFSISSTSGTPSATSTDIKSTAGTGDGYGPYPKGRIHGAKESLD